MSIRQHKRDNNDKTSLRWCHYISRSCPCLDKRHLGDLNLWIKRNLKEKEDVVYFFNANDD